MEDAFQRLLIDMGCEDMGISGARRGSKRGTDGPAFAVKLGSVNVPVYRTEGNGRLRFFVTFYRDGRRVRRSFTNPEDAKTEARLMARKIMAGQSQGTDLSAPEREAYLAAKNLLDGMGCPLVAAAEEYAECKRLLGSRSLLAAVTEHVERTRGVQTEVTVPAAAEEFLKAKKQDGSSTRYLAQLRSDIGRFAADLPGAILSIKSHDIDQWLRRLGGAPRTRNTTHTSLRTFFSWAKSRSYLPRSEETAAEAVAKVRVGDTETEIFTPEQMAKILEAAPAELVPFIVLGAFAGLRAAEITRIEWSAIDLERRFITIRAGQAKTASRRIVPVSANLRAWLLPHVGEGMVVPSAETYRKVTCLARRLGIRWPHNVLRHSFISYRIAKVKNANEVALEAGNSPAVIFKHYRELATEAQADAWFAIRPEPPVIT
jgi:integrase